MSQYQDLSYAEEKIEHARKEIDKFIDEITLEPNVLRRILDIWQDVIEAETIIKRATGNYEEFL